MGRRVTRFLRDQPLVVGADFGIPDRINFSATSAGDTQAARKARVDRARWRATRLEKQVDRSRHARNHDYREMEREVPELRNSKTVLVDFAFGGNLDAIDRDTSGVEILYTPGAREEVKRTNNETFSLLQLGQMLPASLDEAIQLGDSFTELIYKPNQLVAQKPLVPAEDCIIHWDEYTRLEGYTFHAHGSGQTFLPWQVAHLALDQKRGYKYGESNWLAARKLWRAEQAALDVLGILTLLRAAARKSVAYAVPDNIPEDEVFDFVQDMAQGGWSEEIFDSDGQMFRRIASLLELDDIIYPYRASANPPTFHDEPPANLEQMVQTLKYYQERYFVATGVPAGLAGMERNVNARSTLEHQGLFFVRKVKNLQRQVARFTVEILAKGLIAKGIVPKPDEFIVKMPRVSTFDEKVAATADRIKAQTIKLLHIDGGLDLAWVLQFALSLDEDEAYAAAERAHGDSPLGTTGTGTGRPSQEELQKALASDPDFAAWLSKAKRWMGSAVPDVTESS